MSRDRDIALDVLWRVQTQGAFASAALRSAFAKAPDLEGPERGLATELVYGVLRKRAQLDKTITGRGKRMKDLDPKLHDVLRIAAYQLLFLDRVPSHAAVDEAVNQAKKRNGPRGGKLVNAVLRKLADAPEIFVGPALDKDPVAHVAYSGNVSRAIAERLVADLGARGAIAFALASSEKAPLVLRANRMRIERDALVEEVGGTAGEHPLAVHLPDSQGSLPHHLDAVGEGRATVQDEASMRVVDLLAPESGHRVLDLCAAPGGKTTCIAEQMKDQGEVQAYDRTPQKLERIAKSAARLGLGCIQTIEVTPAPDELFDRVLVDAPCSGLGTLRRHPEIRWRYSADDGPRLERVQQAVLATGASRLKDDGVLVYSVCTIVRAEAEAIVEGLEGFEVTEMWRSDPSEPGSPDGFFAARLVKR